VSDDNRRAVLELEHPAQTGNVVSARAQRKLRRSELEAVGLQALNHAALARPVSMLRRNRTVRDRCETLEQRTEILGNRRNAPYKSLLSYSRHVSTFLGPNEKPRDPPQSEEPGAPMPSSRATQTATQRTYTNAAIEARATRSLVRGLTA
jgi:hypothetical protein